MDLFFLAKRNLTKPVIAQSADDFGNGTETVDDYDSNFTKIPRKQARQFGATLLDIPKKHKKLRSRRFCFSLFANNLSYNLENKHSVFSMVYKIT